MAEMLTLILEATAARLTIFFATLTADRRAGLTVRLGHASSPSVQSIEHDHRPRFSLTPTIARRGSMKTVATLKFGLNRLSLASPSSAVSLSALSTSTSTSTRPTPPTRIIFDTRRSSSDCDDIRREPGGSSRTRWLPCGSVSCADAAYGLPLKYCRLAAI